MRIGVHTVKKIILFKNKNKIYVLKNKKFIEK